MSPTVRSAVEFAFFHLAESTAFALATIAIVYMFCIRSSRTRYLIYQLAMIKFLIPLGLLASFGIGPVAFDANLVSDFIGFGVSKSSDLLAKDPTGLWVWAGIAAWLAGVGIFGIINVLSYVRTRQIGARPHTTAASTNLRLQAAMIASGLSKGSLLSVCEDPRIHSIGLVGFLRPRIVVNAAFLKTLSDQELLAAVRHEIAHARRRDNLWRLAHELIVTLFWFHPIVWILRNWLRTESELACDETALSQGEEPQSYAHCLLKAASLNPRGTSAWVTHFSTSSLKKRIRKIITFENKKESKMKMLTIFLSMLACVGLIATTSSRLYAASDVPVSTEKIYNMIELDSPPEAIERAAAAYPTDLHERGISGYAVVEWVLDDAGRVHTPRAIKSSHREFEQPSIDAILNTTWKPGEKEGNPVHVRVRLRFNFSTSD